jgi:hypothetical protein
LAPAIAADYVGGGTGLVEEHEGGWAHIPLPHPPEATLDRKVRPVLLDRPQRLFLCRSPRRRSVDQIVAKDPGSIPRSCSAAWVSTRVRPGLDWTCFAKVGSS